MTKLHQTTLGALLRQGGGSIKTGPFGTALKASEYSETGVPVVSVGEIGNGQLCITSRTPKVGPVVVRRLSEYVLQANDIVFGRKGAVDRSARISDSEDGYFLGSDGIRVRLGTAVDSLYMSYLLRSDKVRGWLMQNAIGTTMASLNQEILSRVPVSLPPLEQQYTVGRALANVDDSISMLDRMIAKKQAIKQGMIQQLLTGTIRLPGFSTSWRIVRLGDLLKRPPRYGINAPAIPFSVDAHTYIRITDIDDAGNFAPDPKVSVRHSNSDDYLLEEGELVFARTGASVGKSYLYNPNDGVLAYAGFLVNIAPDPRVLDPVYLSLVVQTAQYWDWIARTSVRSGQPGVNGREYAQLEITLPDVHEQRAIASAVNDASREIRVLSERRTKADAVKQGMMQQLLTGRTRLPVAEAAS